MVPKGIIYIPVMASEWVKILAGLYRCGKEIGFIWQTLVGGKLIVLQAKELIGMNTRASIIEW
jgi:hypothetical protein